MEADQLTAAIGWPSVRPGAVVMNLDLTGMS
jgi:hypothetical protein